ncbi:MAG: glycosyltransferase family 25 protein [Sutterella sp.]|nr:glycosyltransferase family 25 protein [Sutterella sp.]
MVLFPRYLINLKSSTDRLQSMRARLEPLGLFFERIEAVDAKTLSEEDLSVDQTPSIAYPRKLRSGELACFLSHRECWKRLVASKDDWALVLEDHCVFSSQVQEYLASTDWIPVECELIQFVWSKNPVYFDKQIPLENENSLVRLNSSSPIGTSAYFISKKAAQIALDESQWIYGPVDNFLFGSLSGFSRQVRAWRLLGAVVKRNETTVTTIQGRAQKKVINAKSVDPRRIYTKLRTKAKRLYLDKAYQYWID